MRELARQAEAIRQDLLHGPGVEKINILGERPEQIFVEFSYAKLATFGVSARDIAGALQRQNRYAGGLYRRQTNGVRSIRTVPKTIEPKALMKQTS